MSSQFQYSKVGYGLLFCQFKLTCIQYFGPKGLTFLTRLRLSLSHLYEHRFQKNFQDCANPLCFCSSEIEDTSHYLLHCHHFSHHRVVLINSVKSICDNFHSMSDNVKEDLLL